MLEDWFGWSRLLYDHLFLEVVARWNTRFLAPPWYQITLEVYNTPVEFVNHNDIEFGIPFSKSAICMSWMSSTFDLHIARKMRFLKRIEPRGLNRSILQLKIWLMSRMLESYLSRFRHNFVNHGGISIMNWAMHLLEVWWDNAWVD